MYATFGLIDLTPKHGICAVSYYVSTYFYMKIEACGACLFSVSPLSSNGIHLLVMVSMVGAFYDATALYWRFKLKQTIVALS